ncbi:hypothetical protein AAMO2058_000297700 [Amorphochlora amoebiformis]
MRKGLYLACIASIASIVALYTALPRPHGARPDPLSLPVQAALPLGAGAFLTPLLSRRAMCFTTRQSQFRGDTENLKAAAGVSGKAAEVGARARAVAKPTSAFVALHCALVASKTVIGKGFKSLFTRQRDNKVSASAEVKRAPPVDTAPSKNRNFRHLKALSGDYELVTAGEQDLAMQMMGLGYVFRKATTLARGLRLTASEKSFEIVAKAGIIQIVEKYPYDGSPAKFPRRDKRGIHTGKISHIRDHSVDIFVEWSDPASGTLTQTYHLDGPNKLYIDNVLSLKIDSRTKMPPNPAIFKYRQVYKRKGT